MSVNDKQHDSFILPFLRIGESKRKDQWEEVQCLGAGVHSIQKRPYPKRRG
jgi:hypothetical protein